METTSPNTTQDTRHKYWGSARRVYTGCAFLAILLAAGKLEWTRKEEFSLQGAFYYGYMIMLPISGRLADKFGGKTLFILSIAMQALTLFLLPLTANISHTLAVTTRVVQGLIAGCSIPSIYQLFSKWAHPTERTAAISFAFGGYPVGHILLYPACGFLVTYGWDVPFYVISIIALIFGISCYWLVYDSPESHPRISNEEKEYLRLPSQKTSESSNVVPWKSILTSIPFYAFVLTNFMHNYGFLVISLMIPRLLHESMNFDMMQIALLSPSPFIGCILSKLITVSFAKYIERKQPLDIGTFRRVVYVLCCFCIIGIVIGLMLCNHHYRQYFVVLLVLWGFIGDIAFTMGYFPCLLYMAPSQSGLLMGITNGIGTLNGFLVPEIIGSIVKTGSTEEWSYIFITMIFTYGLAALTFGIFGTTKLQKWDSSTPVEE